MEPALDETANLEDFHGAFLDAFGTTEQIIAEALFQQIVNALHHDPKKPLDAATANLILAASLRVHHGASAMAGSGAGSTPLKPKPSDDGSAS